METFKQMWEGILAFGVVSVALGVFCGALSKLYKAIRRVEQNEKQIEENESRIQLLGQSVIENKEQTALLAESAKINHENNLYKLCEDALKKGYCSQDRRRIIERTNDVYHSLGGNGDMKDIIQKARALPLEPEE